MPGETHLEPQPPVKTEFSFDSVSVCLAKPRSYYLVFTGRIVLCQLAGVSSLFG